MRRTLSIVTLAFVLGAVLMAAMPGMASNGDNLILGQKNNATTPTKLVSRGGLFLKVGIASRSALTLEVVGNWPPIKVNSTGKVANLNVDLLDGKDYLQLRSQAGWVTNSNISDNVNWSDTVKNVTVPAGGAVLLMSGSVDFEYTGTGSDWVQCYFKVDGTELAASRMEVYVQANEFATCHSDGATTVGSGSHTIQFYTSGLSVTDIEADDGTWYYTVVPG